MVQHLLGRKGAARIALIPAEVLDALNEGLLPTVNLNEFLALDLARLARRVAGQVGLPPDHERLSDTLAMLAAFRPVKRHEHVARAFYDLTQPRADRDAIAHALATHASDVARCWAAQWVMFAPLPLARKLEAVHRFADDPHFGVREVAWMAVRDQVAGEVDAAIGLLEPWVAHPRDNIRRFASELTRPRGVWCAQIDALKREPWRALALLEPLRADPSRYVQNSVANWLNDASKTQPQWVQELCDRWSAQSRTPQTAYIVRRATRSLASLTPP
ncbi:DNA alkylation repair protein [Caenimonas aquaedulcis]|uniref:DNA alkylation repair protein n=1 Tax=Caenimonas aquaedulcis TaxID=2793270 RepID=A0A931H707_9BURK|nr:DNA alkylation repair protein [Caenimonas aquaedulcis]MBG9389535.1 DNA alkylation repair protein [Caenimonas aquaedulcis]